MNPEVEVSVSQDRTTALQPGDRARLCLQKIIIIITDIFRNIVSGIMAYEVVGKSIVLILLLKIAKYRIIPRLECCNRLKSALLHHLGQ